MGFKSNCLVIVFFFVITSAALADTTDGINYFLDTSGGVPSFTQRLSWQEDEFSIEYEVRIQNHTGGFYRDYIQRVTTENYIMVSLPPGKYRYCVIPNGLLGLRGQASEWKEFDIIPAYLPVVDRFIPSAFHLDKRFERELYIGGSNLLNESVIYLQNDETIFYPVKIDILHNTRARLTFDDRILIPGIYNIYVKNPGGLETVIDGFIIDYSKPLDIFVKSMWIPYIPLYGELWNIIGYDIFWSGFGFSLEAINSRRADYNSGVELKVSFFLLNSITGFSLLSEGFFDTAANAGNGVLLGEIDINFSFQKIFSHEFALTFRMGIGIIPVMDFGEVEINNNIITQFNTGFTSLILLYDLFHFEAGVDFSLQLYNGSTSGVLKPRLGIVWKF